MQFHWGKVGAAALLSFGASVVPLAASAQSRAGDDTGGGRSDTVSPIDGRGYLISANVRTLYDTNILRIGNGVSERPGYSKSDLRTTPTLDVAVGLPFGRQQLFIEAEVGRDFYVENTQLNRNRYRVDGGLGWRLGRSCSGSVTGSYERRQSLLSEASVLVDNTQEVTNFSARGDCAPGVGLGFGGGVSRDEIQNQSITRAAFDSRTTTFDGHLNYGAGGLGQFTLGGSYSKIAYPGRFLSVPLEGGGFATVGDRLSSYRGQIGYSRQIGARLNLSLSASYIKVKPNPNVVANFVIIPGVGPVAFTTPRSGFTGPGFNVSIAYNPSSRISVTINAARDATAASSVGSEITIHTGAAAEIAYNLSPSLSLASGVNYDYRKYKGGFASVEEPVGRINDAIARGYVRATYSPRKLYSFDLELSHQNRNSNPSIYNFSSTAASIGLRVKFGRG